LWQKFESRRVRYLVIAVLAVLLAVALLLSFGFNLLLESKPTTPQVFVGVDVGFGDEQDVYRIADALEGYANLIIVGSLTITSDTQKLIRVCDYLYDRGFYFIVYVGLAMEGLFPPRGPASDFFMIGENRWGNKLLGAYVFDEPGGKQLEQQHPVVSEADNYTDAALHYTISLGSFSTIYRGPIYYNTNLGMYTSDFGLYWYDYLAGYSVVFGEFVGNQSRQISVALTRGAATASQSEWGVMITWKYQQPPYVEEPQQLYDDMVLAYDNGAKYIVVFNSPDINKPTTSYGILTQDHINSMKNFWNYYENHPRNGQYRAEAAYVLPTDYGYGFRGPNDVIWGLWPADNLSAKAWYDVNALLIQYPNNLDIVYETRIDNVQVSLPYEKLIFWNTTITR
jgi:hypothetical protein